LAEDGADLGGGRDVGSGLPMYNIFSRENDKTLVTCIYLIVWILQI
jgi:hypothetical protein